MEAPERKRPHDGNRHPFAERRLRAANALVFVDVPGFISGIPGGGNGKRNFMVAI
jgi:hypothetical protein